MDLENLVLNGGPDPPLKGAIFGDNVSAYCQQGSNGPQTPPPVLPPWKFL